MKKISIVIPVYNEKNTIREILRRVEAVELNFSASGGPAEGWEKEIILIDDFSTDGTREILSALGGPAMGGGNTDQNYKVFFQEKNMGKGRAVKKGFEEARGDIVLIQDADLEYDPNDYPGLIQPIVDGRADAVYGSRFLKDSSSKIVYKHGYLFSRALSWFSNILSGLKLSDIYTCYKVFSKEAVGKIAGDIKSSRFGIDPELTALIAKNKFRILEVPIRYKGRTYEEGKKINWKDGLAAIWHIIRFNLFH
ncbi:MAG: glycosyl transferase family protein [Parcubacteria group bacterium Gr01-1014_2]|nr:MAG: glycosyl transferase family protein [Parcubacteria group bacterium Gr01-1014_2]